MQKFRQISGFCLIALELYYSIQKTYTENIKTKLKFEIKKNTLPSPKVENGTDITRSVNHSLYYIYTFIKYVIIINTKRIPIGFV